MLFRSRAMPGLVTCPNSEIFEQPRCFFCGHYINLVLTLRPGLAMQPIINTPTTLPSVFLVQREDFQQSSQYEITHHVIEYLFLIKEMNEPASTNHQWGLVGENLIGNALN